MAELIRRVDASTSNVIDGLILFWLSLWEPAAIGDTLAQSEHTLDSAGIG
ncbi:hypothetical protein [Paractinoplanes hotanensis]|uniref:Uncharacterized protein n=1 Tax=Paractinoplanes hotanensis TaxID=2906497 RepID=A0ABT0YDP0_9ACTN|nr:hypothetical protein [Actinoplanes hotanensis]MCM4083870.1 hypothetical protein [Actinoplanes hotanensis]